MTFQQAIWHSRRDYLYKCQPELPVLFFNPMKLMNTAKLFMNGFSGLVTYAVKANPESGVIRALLSSGIDSFDVASPAEIDLIRAIAPHATMHYNNPIRSVGEIEHAVANHVRSFSVDRMIELEKLLKIVPKNVEISVRLKLDMVGAAYDFGAKFGADPDQCIALLQRIKKSGRTTSMTFHPGTQCADPKSWTTYIMECGRIAELADCKLSRLNVGGGFPSHRNIDKPDLLPFFKAISDAVLQYFPTIAPALVCEPGRAMIAEAYSLATCVKALSNNTIFLNDGVYAGLTEFRDIGNIERYSVIKQSRLPLSNKKQDYIAFGPTCDSLDQLPVPLPLPANIAEGDYILFENMGAYVKSIATRFNGYGDFKDILISRPYS